jgi:hypothetical protein
MPNPRPVSAFDALRALMVDQAQQGCLNAGLTAAQIAIEGYPFSEPDDILWVSFSYEVGETMPIELGVAARANQLGGGRERTPGFYQFDIMVPENTGYGVSTPIADALRNWFRYQQKLVQSIGYVNFCPATPRSGFTPKRGFNVITFPRRLICPRDADNSNDAFLDRDRGRGLWCAPDFDAPQGLCAIGPCHEITHNISR